MKVKTNNIFCDKLTFLGYRDYTFEDLAKLKQNTTVLKWEDGIFKCIIVRSFASLCAYIGIPAYHKINDIPNFEEGIECHWGITFNQLCDELGKGYMWYGWDYAHSGDYSFYDFDLNSNYPITYKRKKWVVNDVEAEVKEVVLQIKEIIYEYENK